MKKMYIEIKSKQVLDSSAPTITANGKWYRQIVGKQNLIRRNDGKLILGDVLRDGCVSGKTVYTITNGQVALA